jgi:hypothetical protein
MPVMESKEMTRPRLDLRSASGAGLPRLGIFESRDQSRCHHRCQILRTKTQAAACFRETIHLPSVIPDPQVYGWESFLRDLPAHKRREDHLAQFATECSFISPTDHTHHLHLDRARTFGTAKDNTTPRCTAYGYGINPAVTEEAMIFTRNQLLLREKRGPTSDLL